jgi:hypothetical protein
MKSTSVRTANARPIAKASPTRRKVPAVAKRMDRMVREENRRWGLPLIVMRDGKIVEEPA